MMTAERYPRVTRDKTRLIIEVRPTSMSVRTVQVEAVVDFDQYGDLFGFEVIGLYRQAGQNVLNGLQDILLGTELRSHYDSEVDCLNLTATRDRSLDQRAVRADVMLDACGRLVRAEVSLP